MPRRLLTLALLLAGVAGCASVLDQQPIFVAPSAVVQVRWRWHLTQPPLIEYKPQEFAAATSDGEHVYVGSSAGVLYCFRASDGAELWSTKLGGGVGAEPRLVASEKLLLVGTREGGLWALDAATGHKRWVYRVKGPIESQPIYADGIVYFTTGENRIYAVDARDGTWKWQYDREAPDSFTIRGYASPVLFGGRVYVGFSDGYLACLKPASGEVIWAISLAGDATRFVDVDSTPTVANGVMYVSSYAGGVYALDPKDGSVRWHYPVEGAGTVRVADGRVCFSAARVGVHCLDTDGHLIWRQALAGGELSAPLLLDDYLLVSSAAGGVYVANAANGHLYQYFAPGHGATAPLTTDGKQVYLLSNGGYFYAFSLANG